MEKLRWTREDIKMLRKLYRNHPTADVAKMLDRTLDATKQMAGRLGLRKTAKYRREMYTRK